MTETGLTPEEERAFLARVAEARSRMTKTAEDIAREQGTWESSRYENLLGAGEDLWASDEELDEFLADLRRRKKLEAAGRLAETAWGTAPTPEEEREFLARLAEIRSRMPKTAEQVVREQGKAESSKYENVLGSGRDLWESDEDFADFVALLDRLRHGGE